MAPVDLPYLKTYRSRGQRYAYYRRGRLNIRLRGVFGSSEFLACYEAARQRAEAEPQAPADRPAAAQTGSLAALVDLYRRSPEYRELGEATRDGYDRHLNALLPRFGPLPVAKLPRAWVLAMRDELQDTPRAANYRVAVIKRLLSFSVDRQWRTDNPAARIESLRTGPGHRRWSLEEVAAMTAAAAGEIALPVLIALDTAQRQADVLALTWTAYDGRAITLRQGKAEHLGNAEPMVIPLSPELRSRLDAERARQRAEAEARHLPVPAMICVTDTLRPWRTDWFKHRFAQVRTALGLRQDLHFHGLRHTAASRLAEGGASDAEIQSVTGHRTRSQVERYTKQARQAKLAKSAVAKLHRGRKANPSV